MSGFITIQRQLLDWEWYKDINTKTLFIHCLLKANWEASQWKGIAIERGSFITSNESLSKELNLSIKQIRTAIIKLEKTNEIIKKGANKYTLLSVVKYDFFQNINNSGANKGQTKGKQRATDNNINNITIVNIDDRKLKFASTLKPFSIKYSREMIKDFYGYWTEPNKSNTRFRQETEKNWSLERRLTTWSGNDKKFTKTETKQDRI